MRKTRKSLKIASLFLAIVMLLGMLSVGMTAGAAHYDDPSLATGGFNKGDTVVVNGIKYEMTSSQWWVPQSDIPPSSSWTAIGSVETVTIKDGSGAQVSSKYDIGVEEGSAFFTAEASIGGAVTWSLANNTIGATLNGNYNGGALVSFNAVGTVDLVAKDSSGNTATVTLNVNNNTVQMDVSTVNGPVASGSTLSIEQGQAIDVYVDCTNPSLLDVKAANTNIISLTRGSTGVPVTIMGKAVGTSQVTLTLYGKTVNFTVNVTKATTANFTVNGSPVVGLATVDLNTTIKVDCSLPVNSWAITAGDQTAVQIAKNGTNSVNITGKKISDADLVTVTAYDATNAVLGSFHVYVTKSNNGYTTKICKYDANRTEVTSLNMTAGQSEQLCAKYTVVGLGTALTWELLEVSPAGCVSLTTAGDDGNGNKIATVKANGNGTAKLKATANGISDTITINVGGAVTTDNVITMKLATPYVVKNGTKVNSVVNPQGCLPMPLLVMGGTVLPMRFVCETLGFEVGYDDATGNSSVIDKSSNTTVTLFTGTNRMDVTKNGVTTTVQATAPTILIKNTTHVAVRTLLEQLGYKVAWYESNGGGYIIVSTSDQSANYATLVSAFERA